MPETATVAATAKTTPCELIVEDLVRSDRERRKPKVNEEKSE